MNESSHNQATYFAFFLTWPNRPANVSCFLVGIAAILDFHTETSRRLPFSEHCKLAILLVFTAKQRRSSVDGENQTSNQRRYIIQGVYNESRIVSILSGALLRLDQLILAMC